MNVTNFFTFWGLFPLVRDDVRITGADAMTKALAGMNRPGIGHMKLSKLNTAGLGPWMMRKLATDQLVAQPHDLIEMCLELGVKLWPCEMPRGRSARCPVLLASRGIKAMSPGEVMVIEATDRGSRSDIRKG